MSSSPGVRILVVDDESAIVDAVSTALRYEGFDVDEAVTGKLALTIAREGRHGLIVLDVMLPDLDGFTIAEALRSEGVDTPIIFLTARDDLGDKVRGLAIGGDDYLTKPFALVELVARVNAILRRGERVGFDDHVIEFADLVLDESSHELTRAGNRIEVTATEFRLLRYFMLNPRRVLSKTQIFNHVWGYDFGSDSNLIETYISMVRRKLERFGPPLIFTKRLVGYVLRDPSEGT